MPELQLSIVIPTWNRKDDLARTLAVVEAQASPPREIIVVDNASTDDTVAMVVERHPGVRLIRLPRNIGPTGARNAGVAQATAPVVVLLDSDTEPFPGALAAIARRFQDDPRLGVVNALQIDQRSGKPWWWWGPHGFALVEYLDREFDSAAKIEEGACALRRDLYMRVGGFDERFFMLVEGRDLAARVVRTGFAVRYCPDVRFLHRAESNRPASNAVYTRSGRLYYEFRNEIWYTWRYFPLGWAALKTVRNAFSNLRIAAREHAVPAYIRATLDGVRGLGWVISHRLPLRRAELAQVVSRERRKWFERGDMKTVAP